MTDTLPQHNFRELKPGTFIYAMDQALTPTICEQAIQRFEENPEQQNAGRMGQDAKLQQSIKRSTDIAISGQADWKDIDQALNTSLQQALGLVAGLHPFFRSNRLHDSGYNLQRSAAGDHYHWHVDGGPGAFSQRQLVAIWYLNDAPEIGGETEFHFQGVSVRPKRGMLLLFPPFWTHLHRGREVGEGVKYIATTWVCTD